MPLSILADRTPRPSSAKTITIVNLPQSDLVYRTLMRFSVAALPESAWVLSRARAMPHVRRVAARDDRVASVRVSGAGVTDGPGGSGRWQSSGKDSVSDRALQPGVHEIPGQIIAIVFVAVTAEIRKRICKLPERLNARTRGNSWVVFVGASQRCWRSAVVAKAGDRSGRTRDSRLITISRCSRSGFSSATCKSRSNNGLD